jgi:hypothetical protein
MADLDAFAKMFEDDDTREFAHQKRSESTPTQRLKLPQRVIVGLSGFANVGKDAVRTMLCEQHGFVGAAFADKVRAFATELNVYLPEIGETYTSVIKRMGYDAAKRTHPCVRKHLIAVGHGARTALYPNIWVDVTLPPPASFEYAAFAANTQPLVISDVRYASEVKRIHDLGGLVYRITRPGHDAVDPTEARSLAEAPYDVLLINDGSLETFLAIASAVIVKLAQ